MNCDVSGHDWPGYGVPRISTPRRSRRGKSGAAVPPRTQHRSVIHINAPYQQCPLNHDIVVFYFGGNIPNILLTTTMLLDFPNDILLLVADEVETESDLSSLIKTCRCLYGLLSDKLHRDNVRYCNSSALFWGMRRNRFDTMQRMLDVGADIDSTEDGQTLLYHAACDGHVSMVKFLLERGASHQFRKARLQTPLCAAAVAGHTDIVKVLLDHEIPEEKEATSTATALPPGKQDIFLLQLFTTDGPGVHRNGLHYSIPLFLAIACAHTSTAETLMASAKVDLNYRDSIGRTPLLWALSHRLDRIATLLLEHGADGNVVDPRTNQSPLLTAVCQKDERVVRLLLPHPTVDPNWTDTQGRNSLMEVLSPSAHVSLLRLLLTRADLDVNYCGGGIQQSTNYTTTTPLCIAVRRDDIAAVTLLLEHPAIDVDATGSDGRTPLSHAAELGRLEYIDILLAHGADPGRGDQHGRTPISYAAEYNDIRVVEILSMREGSLGVTDRHELVPSF